MNDSDILNWIENELSKRIGTGPFWDVMHEVHVGDSLRDSVAQRIGKITDVIVTCSACGWTGTVEETEPDVDGDGSLGCPICLSVVECAANENVVGGEV